ncbi:divisome protein SepX/GlpR [Actinacidiphila yeochonensis]|uniref:divisome protein SepX/GlpR n=1 Tax=Actinacidiphila yeochonensis TaxID=89050 RepID=UPI00055FA1D3|nr:hypothetical protein [Actinacidiphila yeochonensis]
MSSSGLIYAVIVGAWAAYLVPMWLRRQDELNEARPTERFSTAIRLLSGRAAMERRVAKARGDGAPSPDVQEQTGGEEQGADEPVLGDAVDVRGLAVPVTEVRKPASRSGAAPAPAGLQQAQRATVLARRRRTTTLLFLAFTAGAIAAAVGGVALLWAPAVPAVLLTLYIGQMRRQERRRYEVRIDQRHAVEAARRLRAPRAPKSAPATAGEDRPAPAAGAGSQLRSEMGPVPARSVRTADRRAVVEQTDHAEWVDQQRSPTADADGWDPAPVPLPTYVTAPVAPRSPGPGASDSWSPTTSGSAPGERPQGHEERDAEPAGGPRGHRGEAPSTPRRPRASRTPLFDQYEDPARRRAANE